MGRKLSVPVLEAEQYLWILAEEFILVLPWQDRRNF
jgi:hypothetical protein